MLTCYFGNLRAGLSSSSRDDLHDKRHAILCLHDLFDLLLTLVMCNEYTDLGLEWIVLQLLDFNSQPPPLGV